MRHRNEEKLYYAVVLEGTEITSHDDGKGHSLVLYPACSVYTGSRVLEGIPKPVRDSQQLNSILAVDGIRRLPRFEDNLASAIRDTVLFAANLIRWIWNHRLGVLVASLLLATLSLALVLFLVVTKSPKPAEAYVVIPTLESIVTEVAFEVSLAEPTLAEPVIVVKEPIKDAKLISARLSHYWPPLGGTNCSRYVGGQCISKMASGEAWQDWVGKAVACPIGYPFWTKIILPGGEEFYCLDRGGGIVGNWFDLLVEIPPVAYGSVIDVWVVFPE